MKTFLNYTLAMLMPLCLWSCSEDTEGVDEFLEVHANDLTKWGLSAGTSTIFWDSSKAYDIDAEWLSGKYATRFQHGNRLYDNVTENYGPVYAGYSCASCHANAGRTNP